MKIRKKLKQKRMATLKIKVPYLDNILFVCVRKSKKMELIKVKVKQ